MTKLFRTLFTGSSLLACTAAHADAVADWNAIALNAVESSGAPPAAALRALAGVHVAMFEAMNFIERRYVPRLVVRPASPIAASSEAAAAAAAHLVLSRLYPESSAAFDAALERSLAEMPEDRRKATGTITGRAIGGNVYAVWTWDEAPARAAGRGSRAFRAERSCVPCAAGVATLKVLESALDKPALRKRDDGTILRALLSFSERSADHSDRRLGEGIGAQALGHYRPAS